VSAFVSDESDEYAKDLPGIVGQTMRSVDVVKADDVTHFFDELRFESVDGVRWSMSHTQDCCEQVGIEDIVGDLSDLVGSPIVMAEVTSNTVDPPKEGDEYDDDSHTWTFYKFATAKGYVTIRWYGSSTGYYSESVSFQRVTTVRPGFADSIAAELAATLSPPAPVVQAPLGATPSPTGAAVEIEAGKAELAQVVEYLRRSVAIADANDRSIESRAGCLGLMLGAAEVAASRIEYALALIAIGEKYR
jgi:hypothetical protein